MPGFTFTQYAKLGNLQRLDNGDAVLTFDCGAAIVSLLMTRAEFLAMGDLLISIPSPESHGERRTGGG